MSEDRIQPAIDDLTAKLKAAGVVQTNVIQVYRQDSVSQVVRMQGAPSIAVSYLGMNGKSDSSRTGASTHLNVGVYLIWKDGCCSTEDGQVLTAIQALHQLREAIMASCNPGPSGHRKWEFQIEIPFDLGEHMAYVQRWRTTAVFIPQQ